MLGLTRRWPPLNEADLIQLDETHEPCSARVCLQVGEVLDAIVLEARGEGKPVVVVDDEGAVARAIQDTEENSAGRTSVALDRAGATVGSGLAQPIIKLLSIHRQTTTCAGGGGRSGRAAIDSDGAKALNGFGLNQNAATATAACESRCWQ
jgi:hypothetical protein